MRSTRNDSMRLWKVFPEKTPMPLTFVQKVRHNPSIGHGHGYMGERRGRGTPHASDLSPLFFDN